MFRGNRIVFQVFYSLVDLKMSIFEDSPKKIKNPYTKTINEYASVSTAHGIAYIFEDGRCFLERIIWIIVVVLALTFAICMSTTAYKNWKNNPVLTSVRTTGLPIENIEFPAITICTQGSANEVVDAALFQQFNSYLMSKGRRFEDLSESEKVKEGQSFLIDLYPGAKAPPNQLVSMMASPGIDPERGIEALTIFNPEDKKNCAADNEETTSTSTTTKKARKKRNVDGSSTKNCPTGYKKTGKELCLHNSELQMNFTAAKEYCSVHSENSVLLQLKHGYEGLIDDEGNNVASKFILM